MAGGGWWGRAARWVVVSRGARKGRALFLQREWVVGGANCLVTNWHQLTKAEITADGAGASFVVDDDFHLEKIQ